MTFLQELENLGVDVQEGLGRVMDDESLYVMMCGMFVDSVQSAPISLDEFDGASLDELTGKIHALKGTTGNLSLTPLFTRYEKSLTLLRAGRPAEAKAVYQELLPFQAQILDCIQRNQG
ncbi:MAG: hypothetical protein K2N78_07015 [Oscillospiraceae bacterium]|nr:hypothetical protein [Oscillospiraceae bacterium]